jgi:hypothetical protein
MINARDNFSKPKKGIIHDWPILLLAAGLALCFHRPILDLSRNLIEGKTENAIEVSDSGPSAVSNANEERINELKIRAFELQQEADRLRNEINEVNATIANYKRIMGIRQALYTNSQGSTVAKAASSKTTTPQ